MLKTCSSCKQSKDVLLFSKNSSAKDGRQNQCKECYKISATKCYEQRKANGKISFTSDEYKEKNKKYRDANKEKINARRKRYREKNKDRINELNRLDYERNKEKRLDTCKKYCSRNSEYIRKLNSEKYQRNKETYSNKRKEYLKTANGILVARKARARRKALMRNATIGEVDINKVVSIKKCYWCGVKLKSEYHIDHYIPISKGGLHTTDNLVISCKKCNLRKGAKDPLEFAKEVQKLF